MESKAALSSRIKAHKQTKKGHDLRLVPKNTNKERARRWSLSNKHKHRVCTSLCIGRLLLVKSINTQTHKHKPLLLVMALLVNNGLVVIRGVLLWGGRY